MNSILQNICQKNGLKYFFQTLEGLKLAADIGAPRTVKVISHKLPRRKKKEPGLRPAHEYRMLSFKEEYSFTYQQIGRSIATLSI